MEEEDRQIKRVHMSHCYQGEYETTCKYGDNDCPAKPKMINEMIDIREISPRILRIIEMHFQAHKRYGESTIETEMRFKDLKSDIIKLLNDSLGGLGE